MLEKGQTLTPKQLKRRGFEYTGIYEKEGQLFKKENERAVLNPVKGVYEVVAYWKRY